MNDTDTSEHRRAWDAIPWVVNGSAGDDERAMVERHIRACSDCSDEWEFQSRLHQGVTTPTSAPPIDDALQRLWARVDARGGAGSGGRETRSRHPGRAGPETGSSRGGSRWLAAAVVVQAIGLLALSGLLWTRTGDAQVASTTAPQAAYQTLSLPPGPAAQATLRMVASPAMTIGELPALLARCGVEIVQSSRDGSIFALAPRRGAGRSTAESLALLRAEPQVRLAEPIVADGATTPP